MKTNNVCTNALTKYPSPLLAGEPSCMGGLHPAGIPERMPTNFPVPMLADHCCPESRNRRAQACEARKGIPGSPLAVATYGKQRTFAAGNSLPPDCHLKSIVYRIVAPAS